MDRVLEAIRVLDLSYFKAGPTCAQILADMGAEVIKLERPGGGPERELPPYTPEGRGFYQAYTCRNKKGITLNLGKQRGQEILRSLVQQTDIVVESFGPAVNKKLGVNLESLREIKHDIIVVAISAYGQNGPYAERTGFDAIAQGIAGLMWVTGFPEGRPLRAGVSFVDMATGICGALGALLALYHRDKTGKGQLVDISLLDVAMMFTESIPGEYKVAGKVRPQIGNASVLIAPYDAFEVKDGWVFIGTATQSQWEALCKVVGREELANDPKFKTMRERVRPESRQFFSEWLGAWVEQRTTDELVNQLNEAGVPCGRINTVPEVFSVPQIRARRMIIELNHPGLGMIPLGGIPIKLSESPGEIKSPAPALGEHNDEVYSNLLGLTPEQIAQLREEGTV